jgi:hypothetical protein
MVVADALMPTHALLPVAAGADNWLSLDLRYVPDRSREPVVFKTYFPDELSGVYGSDGDEIVIQRMGRIIDLYV